VCVCECEGDLSISDVSIMKSCNLNNLISFYAGHYLDQKRLKQGLYRHPWDDISYVLPEHMTM